MWEKKFFFLITRKSNWTDQLSTNTVFWYCLIANEFLDRYFQLYFGLENNENGKINVPIYYKNEIST